MPGGGAADATSEPGCGMSRQCPDDARGGAVPRRGHRRAWTSNDWNPPGRVAGSLGSAGGAPPGATRGREPARESVRGDRLAAPRVRARRVRLRRARVRRSPEESELRPAGPRALRLRLRAETAATRRRRVESSESSPQLREERCRAPFGPNGSARIVRNNKNLDHCLWTIVSGPSSLDHCLWTIVSGPFQMVHLSQKERRRRPYHRAYGVAGPLMGPPEPHEVALLLTSLAACTAMCRSTTHRLCQRLSGPSSPDHRLWTVPSGLQRERGTGEDPA